jgi:hypothetical protein
MERNLPNVGSVFPDPLVMTQNNKASHCESLLNISNLTNEYIIFKLYNNQHTLYSAKPSTSFIPPKGNIKVKIKRYKKEENNGKDKFLLVFYTINKIIDDNEEAREAFNSKIYNENSKQETLISIILKDEEIDDIQSTLTYNESILDEIGDDYIKGIKIYNDLNENLRKQANNYNEKIKNIEKTIEMIKTQKQLKNEKDKAMKDNKYKVNSDDNSFFKIILICLMLLGLIIGANIAKGYNLVL